MEDLEECVGTYKILSLIEYIGPFRKALNGRSKIGFRGTWGIPEEPSKIEEYLKKGNRIPQNMGNIKGGNSPPTLCSEGTGNMQLSMTLQNYTPTCIHNWLSCRSRN